MTVLETDTELLQRNVCSIIITLLESCRIIPYLWYIFVSWTSFNKRIGLWYQISISNIHCANIFDLYSFPNIPIYLMHKRHQHRGNYSHRNGEKLSCFFPRVLLCLFWKMFYPYRIEINFNLSKRFRKTFSNVNVDLVLHIFDIYKSVTCHATHAVLRIAEVSRIVWAPPLMRM